MLEVKNIGKPCAGEPHARFDEGGQGETNLLPTLPGLFPVLLDFFFHEHLQIELVFTE